MYGDRIGCPTLAFPIALYTIPVHFCNIDDMKTKIKKHLVVAAKVSTNQMTPRCWRMAHSCSWSAHSNGSAHDRLLQRFVFPALSKDDATAFHAHTAKLCDRVKHRPSELLLMHMTPTLASYYTLTYDKYHTYHVTYNTYDTYTYMFAKKDD